MTFLNQNRKKTFKMGTFKYSVDFVYVCHYDFFAFAVFVLFWYICCCYLIGWEIMFYLYLDWLNVFLVSNLSDFENER